MVPVRRNQNWLPGIFNDFFGNEWIEKANSASPAINIIESDTDYKVELAAPGMTKDDFSVKIDADNQLVVSMEKKEEHKDEDKKGRYLRREFSYSRFQQVMILPENVEKDKIDAKVQNGVLTIDIPKKQEAVEAKKVKEIAVTVELGGKTVTIGAIAKGSGMIHPNMGTMLCFLTTDCAISSEMIKSALLETVQVSFNRISVDGDTSTNDTCCVLANGLAGNPVITEKGPDYDAFVEALRALCVELAKKMASDGEGATHLITCTVTGAGSEQSAETVAKSVIGSALTKAAIFGADANWGRVLCAMGYSGEDFNPDKVDVAFQSQAGSVQVCAKGRGLDFDEDLAKRVLTEHDVTIAITMGEGDSSCTCWGCDLTYEYVKINGDYRT